MTLSLLVRRFSADVARNPVNVFVLVAVPVVFVVAAAGMLAGVGRILGAGVDGTTMARLTAGWSAAFVAAVAMYFQGSAGRGTDRRMVGAGLRRSTLVATRLLTGGLLALVASAAALLSLVVRNGAGEPWRVAVGTLMFAGVYLGLGALVGATVRNPLNGTVLLLFVWILDVFFGPGLSGSDSAALRLMPTHYLSLWEIEPASSPQAAGNLVRALAWLAVALGLGLLALRGSTSVGRRRPPRTPGALGQLGAGLRMAWRSWRRTPVLWALLVVVPAVFIWLADATTPHGTTVIQLREAGRTVAATFDPADIHAGTMAPIAVASLAALAGVLVGIDARAADRRLSLAGQRPWVLAVTRLATAVFAAVLATAAALAVAGAVFDARRWPVYAAGNLLVALTYALLGLLVGPLVGRVSGTLLAFLVPFVDLALGQSPMLHATTPVWATILPGFGGTRVALVGGLAGSFGEGRGLVLALAWVTVLLVLVVGARVRTATRSLVHLSDAKNAAVRDDSDPFAFPAQIFSKGSSGPTRNLIHRREAGR